jgi:hypothetical protein
MTRPGFVLLAATLAAASFGCGSSPLQHDAAADADAGAGGSSDRAVEEPAEAGAVDRISSDGGADVAPVEAGSDGPSRADRAPTEGGLSDPCWDDNDCHPGPPGFLLCEAPGESFGCPICDAPPATCTSDQQCAAADAGASMICEPASCACHGERTCRPGCTTDVDCGPGSACSAAHRCGAKACTTDGECPHDFTCVAGLGCQRSACTRDDQCSVACVKGRCYDLPGKCMSPPA